MSHSMPTSGTFSVPLESFDGGEAMASTGLAPFSVTPGAIVKLGNSKTEWRLMVF